MIQRSRYMNILAELDGLERFGDMLAMLRDLCVTIYDVDLTKQPESKLAEIGVHLSIYLPRGINHTELLARLSTVDGMVTIEEGQ